MFNVTFFMQFMEHTYRVSQKTILQELLVEMTLCGE